MVLGGILAGILVIIVAVVGVNQFKNGNLFNLPKVGPESSPQATTTPLDGREENNNQELKEQTEQFRQKLFEEGITINATVDRVFPGIGFIISNDEDKRFFVHWTSTPAPTKNQTVVIKGTVARVSEKIIGLRSQHGGALPSDLEDFFANKSIFIEAKQVSIAR